ncbi:chemotaxis protein CheW [Nitrospira sp. Kam-Ns4a]
MAVNDATPSTRLSLVLFVVADRRYALHLAAVEAVVHMVELSPLPRAPAIVLGVINLHGRIVPVLDLPRRLGLASPKPGLTAWLLIARTSRRTVALPVTEVLGVAEVAAGAVAEPDAVFPGIGLVAGLVTLPDGVLFIHDLEAFLTPDEERRLAETLAEAGP